jgi:protein-L-isoaspartate(D-aspartate) O-methyltransferase
MEPGSGVRDPGSDPHHRLLDSDQLIHMDLTDRRRFYAEEIQVIANIRTPALVDALAQVPREKFLPPGPWQMRSEIDYGGGPRQTPDDDPRHVYHNVVIAIDAARQLFNGAPSLLCICIDALGLTPGARAVHVGCATGYYSALMAHAVGPSGSLLSIDVDESLAAAARSNLKELDWVNVRHGDGTDVAPDSVDAILVNAGMTHPHESWLNALRPGGRLLIPLTFTLPQMGPISKGVMTLVTRNGDAWDARIVTMTAIFSGIGLRDDRMNDRLREAFMKGQMPSFKRMRRDPHEPGPACWLHGDSFCFST